MKEVFVIELKKISAIWTFLDWATELTDWMLLKLLGWMSGCLLFIWLLNTENLWTFLSLTFLTGNIITSFMLFLFPCGESWKAHHFSSVQFSHSVMSDSLRPYKSQHVRPPCPSLTPRVHTDSCPSSQWCHPAISSSVVTFSSCPQSLPTSESFPMSQLFAWGGQSTGVSALASFLPKKSRGWSPLEWTGWISLQSKGLARVSSNTTVQKHQFFGTQPSSQSNSHIHTWPLEKP